MTTSDARYHSITLEPDDLSTEGVYRLKFSTMPGMSTSVGELHEGDLENLARILAEHGLVRPAYTHDRDGAIVPAIHQGRHIDARDNTGSKK